MTRLEDLSLIELKAFHPAFDEFSLEKVRHRVVMEARRSDGGTAPTSVLKQIERRKSGYNWSLPGESPGKP